MKQLKAIEVNQNSVKQLQSEIYIYNEAIKEFEALENRNCNNCKKQETLMCPVTSFGGNIEDFSCNRWESKC